MISFKKLLILIFFLSKTIFSSEEVHTASSHIAYGDSLFSSAKMFSLDVCPRGTKPSEVMFYRALHVHSHSQYFQAIEAYHRAESQLDSQSSEDVKLLIDLYQKLSEIHHRLRFFQESMTYANKILELSSKDSKPHQWAKHHLSTFGLPGEASSQREEITTLMVCNTPTHTTHARLRQKIKDRERDAKREPDAKKIAVNDAQHSLAKADQHMVELLEALETPKTSKKQKKRARQRSKKQEKIQIHQWLFSLVNQTVDSLVEKVIVVNESVEKTMIQIIAETIDQLIEQETETRVMIQKQLEEREGSLIIESIDSSRPYKEEAFKRMEGSCRFLLSELSRKLKKKKMSIVIVGGFAVGQLTKSYQTSDIDIVVYPELNVSGLSVLDMRSAVMYSMLEIKEACSMRCAVKNSTKKGTSLESETTPTKLIDEVNRVSLIDVTYCLDSLSPDILLPYKVDCSNGLCKQSLLYILTPHQLAVRLLKHTDLEYIKKSKKTADTTEHKLASWKKQIKALSEYFLKLSVM